MKLKTKLLVMFNKLILNLILMISFMLCNQTSAAQDVINLHLAQPSISDSPKNQYIHTLLKQSFAKVGKTVNFIYSVKPMNNMRVVEELERNNSIDLAWLSIPPEFHPKLVHTSSPIYKGLHGKRLLMINKNQQSLFANISQLDELKPLIALQKQSWSDFQVLKRNGLTVNGELDYKGMIKALDSGLADYFPRSVTAIEAETAKQKHLNLMIEPAIMLQYPSNYFFYSNSRNQELVDLLEQGLSKLQKSGEFDALYLTFFGDTERRLQLSSKKVFYLR